MEQIIICAVSCVGITLFFQACMHPGMILHWYLKFLCEIYKYGWLGKHMAKFLGMCPYCYGFWLVFIVANERYSMDFNEGFVLIGIWYLLLEIILQKVPNIVYIVPKHWLINKN